MNTKTIKNIFSCSILVVCVVTLILSIAGLFDLDLSDTFRRVLGGLNLVGIGALAYSGMKLRNGNDQKQ